MQSPSSTTTPRDSQTHPDPANQLSPTPSSPPPTSPSHASQGISTPGEHPALLQHPQFQALYRQLLLSLNQHGWRDGGNSQQGTALPLNTLKRHPDNFHGASTANSLPLSLAETLQRRLGGSENAHAQQQPHYIPQAPYLNQDLRRIQQNLQQQLAVLQQSEAVNHLPPSLGYRGPSPPVVANHLSGFQPHTPSCVPSNLPGASDHHFHYNPPRPQHGWAPAGHFVKDVDHGAGPTAIPSIPNNLHEATASYPTHIAPPQSLSETTDSPTLQTTVQRKPLPISQRVPPDLVDDHEETSTSNAQKSDVDPQAESKHFREVCQAFATYEPMAMVEVSRMERHFKALSEFEKGLLMESVDERIDKIKNGIATNQRFLNLLISQDLDMVDDELGYAGRGAPQSRRSSTEGHSLQGLLSDFNRAQAAKYEESCSSDYQYTDPIEPGCAIEDCEVSSMNMYKVRSTLKQFAREWSAERAVEREAAFKPLLEALDVYLPLEKFKAREGRLPWVLCPGSGLGRLPFEVVTKGYSCQGNEFSYFMLLGSNFILNHALEPASISLVPFCLNSCNRREHEDHLQVINIPDVCAADGVSADVDFSMCAGDFVEVYTPQKQAWDAVLTCFFIDTAKNVICYIHTIANILPPGGLWANVGPLLYHFADSVTEMSIELSWEEIRRIITIYFDIKEERWIDAFYTTPPRSMLQALYHCIFFVAIRNDVPVPPEALTKASRASSSPALAKEDRKNSITATDRMLAASQSDSGK